MRVAEERVYVSGEFGVVLEQEPVCQNGDAFPFGHHADQRAGQRT
jgi:hypothetical protein